MISPATKPSSLLLLVDGHALAYRAFFAIKDLRAPDGAPTNAIYGFIKMLERMRAVVQPGHLLVIWDGGLAAERLALLPDYKAQRPPMPADLKRQLDEILAFLAAAGVASGCQPGVEADDWIATAARQALDAGLAVCIASPDKDFNQLISPRVSVLNPGDKSEQPWGAEQVRAKTGVEPAQIVDWLSLVGDSSDNIPGAPGVGPKTAAKLLAQFGNLDACYQRLAEVQPERLRQTLQTSRALVRRNRDLIRLNDALPVEFRLADYAARRPDPARLRSLYERWGFKVLAEQTRKSAGSQGELF